MRQIVKEILETESKIREILDQGRRKASEMRLAAGKEGSEQTNDARQEAQRIMQAAAEEARKKSEQIREETLRRADQQTRALLDGKQDVIENLVAKICTVILNTECEMDDQ